MKNKLKKDKFEKGNFLKSKQMTFGQDKKLAPSTIQDIDKRYWMKPGAMLNFDEAGH